MNKLTECEEMVMKIIWSESSDPDLMTVTNKVNAAFEKKWKIQTVATFLTRLKEKGFIDVYKIGRYSHYHPIADFKEYKKIKISEMLDQMFDGDKNAFHTAIDEL